MKNKNNSNEVASFHSVLTKYQAGLYSWFSHFTVGEMEVKEVTKKTGQLVDLRAGLWHSEAPYILILGM